MSLAVSSPHARRSLSRAEIRTLALASLGGALEFYDFVIFVFFVPVIGQLFFPADLPAWLRQVQTFGIFAVGYLARPLGGIIMAHLGDLRGRKSMFLLSLTLMAVSTLLIGLLPTYRSLGIAAPLLLLCMRVAQGAAIGAEAPGGWVFVAEHVAAERVGLAVGLLTSGLTVGILLGSLTATACSLVLSPEQVAGGFWRLPFLLGGVFGFAAIALRRHLQETPVFQAMRSSGATSKAFPLATVLRTHRAAVATSMLSTWMLTAAIVVVILMAPSLLQRSFGTAPQAALLANLAGTAALSLSCIAVGIATDRFGTRAVATVMLPVLVLGFYGLLLAAARRPDMLLPFYLLAGAGVGAVSLTPISMVRAFPAAVRFSGLSFSYNVAYAAFGGVTPLLVSWLVHFDRLGPAHYVAGAALVGLLATWFSPGASRSG